MNEPLTLAVLQRAMLDFLRGREDAVVIGAQAVNAYVGEPRMTQDIDLMSVRAGELAEELREHLAEKFHIAVRLRTVAEGRGFRLYQVQKSGNRHLADIRPVESLPASKRIAGVLVLSPAELIASKAISCHKRRGQPKSGTDWRDAAMLLLKFPELKCETGPVADSLKASGSGPEIMALWKQWVAQDIRAEAEDDEF